MVLVLVKVRQSAGRVGYKWRPRVLHPILLPISTCASARQLFRERRMSDTTWRTGMVPDAKHQEGDFPPLTRWMFSFVVGGTGRVACGWLRLPVGGIDRGWIGRPSPSIETGSPLEKMKGGLCDGDPLARNARKLWFPVADPRSPLARLKFFPASNHLRSGETITRRASIQSSPGSSYWPSILSWRG